MSKPVQNTKTLFNLSVPENQILLGDALEHLKTLPDESIDLVVTDPPYGYSFMNKDWDKAVVSTEVWKECLRVLKAGAFAFIMSAPRQDVLCKMILNLIDAGFETNFTSIYWTYSQGFPKAANVSKLVDKRNGKYGTNLIEFVKYLKQMRDKKGITNKQIDEYLNLKSNGATASHYTCTDGQQPRFPRLELYYKLKEYLELDDRYDNIIEEAERNKIPSTGNLHKNSRTHGWSMMPLKDEYLMNDNNPVLEQAKKLDGSYAGFQPKPSIENIIKVQKPLDTIAELTIITSNCLYWIHNIEWQNANIVKENSNLLQIVREFIAQNNAMEMIVEEATASIGKVAKQYVQMDTLKSILEELTEKQDTNWNIDTLWKIILVANLAMANKFTTETITEQITELKTLNLLLSQNIQNNTTTQEKTQQNGFKLNVSIVEIILKSVLVRLINTQTIIAHSNVSQEENQSLNVKVVEKSLKLGQNGSSEKENSVLPNAMTPNVKIVMVVMKPLSEKSFVDQALKNISEKEQALYDIEQIIKQQHGIQNIEWEE